MLCSSQREKGIFKYYIDATLCLLDYIHRYEMSLENARWMDGWTANHNFRHVEETNKKKISFLYLPIQECCFLALLSYPALIHEQPAGESSPYHRLPTLHRHTLTEMIRADQSDQCETHHKNYRRQSAIDT